MRENIPHTNKSKEYLFHFFDLNVEGLGSLVKFDEILSPSGLSWRRNKLFSNIISPPPISQMVPEEIDVMEDLLFELSSVRKCVYREYQWFKSVGLDDSQGEKNEETECKGDIHPQLIHQKRRLLYLFVRDLTKGVSGEVLENKERRDFRKLEKVSLELKIATWIFVLLLNVGLLFYVYLFAMNQTHSRQSAWFRSFIMWLFFEVFVSSTGMVLLVHLLIPLYAMSDVSKMKEKILNDLTSFREKYVLNRYSSGRTKSPALVDTPFQFNAAKYFFVSWRIASLFPQIPESEFILQFTTPWPKKSFGKEKKEIELSSYYEDQALFRVLAQICLIFFVSLLHSHHLIQDLLFKFVSDSSLGYLMYLMVRLYLIHPLLPVTIFGFTIGLIFVLLRSAAHSEMVQKLQRSKIHCSESVPEILPNKCEEDVDDCDKKLFVEGEDSSQLSVDFVCDSKGGEENDDLVVQLETDPSVNENVRWDPSSEEGYLSENTSTFSQDIDLSDDSSNAATESRRVYLE